MRYVVCKRPLHVKMSNFLRKRGQRIVMYPTVIYAHALGLLDANKIVRLI